jgi:hypothetical protein
MSDSSSDDSRDFIYPSCIVGVALIFTILKLTDVIQSWYWILSSFIIGYVLSILLLIVHAAFSKK